MSIATIRRTFVAPAPIRVHPPQGATTPVRVAAVSPCFNRRSDIVNILSDLTRLDTTGIELTFIVVDNASTEPLSTIPIPEGIHCKVIFHRVAVNGGGAGGFNAGMRHAIETLPLETQSRFDFIWLIDSDCRLTPSCLTQLLGTLKTQPGLAAVGSALRDPLTGITFEVGGIINRRNGCYGPAAHGPCLDINTLVYCDYLAACSILARREVLEKAGIMPELFLNGDDVDMSLNIKAVTGLQLAGDPASVVYHPWRKFQTNARYFIARNSFGPMARLGLSRYAVLKRALLEVFRACAQTVMSADELAELHLRGLADAAAGKTSGPAPAGIFPKLTLVPFAQLAATLSEIETKLGRKPSIFLHPYLLRPLAGMHDLRIQVEQLNLPSEPIGPWHHRVLGQRLKRELIGAVKRLLLSKPADVAIVPTGWPTGWFRGDIQIEVATDGYLIKEVRKWPNFFRSLKVLARGVALSFKLAIRAPKINEIPQLSPPVLQDDHT